jgi:hypothetical protein
VTPKIVPLDELGDEVRWRYLYAEALQLNLPAVVVASQSQVHMPSYQRWKEVRLVA